MKEQLFVNVLYWSGLCRDTESVTEKKTKFHKLGLTPFNISDMALPSKAYAIMAFAIK